MTKFFMVTETGAVYTEEELQAIEESGQTVDREKLREVRPAVPDPDDSTPTDWTDEF